MLLASMRGDRDGKEVSLPFRMVKELVQRINELCETLLPYLEEDEETP